MASRSDSEYGLPERVTFAGYSDDIVCVSGPPIGTDEFYWEPGDRIHIRYPSGSKIVIKPEFGRNGWEFHIDAPADTHVEYEHADA